MSSNIAPRHWALLVFACALAMALFVQGTRGLWDPDEGRYSNVALQMVDSGDYLTPRRNDDALHLTKPPLSYWAIAASVKAFGRNEWALRLPLALAYALTVALVFSLGRVFSPQRPWLPALVYASFPLPFLAANTLTTDTFLTCAETAAMLAYVRFRFSAASPRWLDAMWALFGLAFMVKGPPALLPLLAIVVWELSRRSTAVAARPFGLLAFALIGLSWFAVILERDPNLWSYFINHEVIGRVATAQHHRHGEWYGGFQIYLPTLIFGALPWGVIALWRRWRHPSAPSFPSNSRFLWCWFGLPLLVFLLARSRLPFYLLPLFVPISLLIAQSLADFEFTRFRVALAAGWLGLLLLGKAFIAFAPSDQDARKLAEDLRQVLPVSAEELVFVEDKPRYGLRFYLDAEVERISIGPLDAHQQMSDTRFDDHLANELAESEPGVYFLVPKEKVDAFTAAVRNRGFEPTRLGVVRRVVVFQIVGAKEQR